MVQSNVFVEWVYVYGNCYGIFKKVIEECIVQGLDVILEIDFQGVLQIREVFVNVVLVFIFLFSWEELCFCLEWCGEDILEVIEVCFKNVVEEMVQVSKFDFVIINELFECVFFDLKVVVYVQ